MITYTDKVSIISNPNPDVNKVTAADMNEIKSEVNSAITSIAATVPTSRTITIDGITYDLSANRSWTTSGGSAVLDWYNVKSYGVIGDGVANEIAALNALVALVAPYSILYFPVGTYYLASQWLVDKPIHIVGDWIGSDIFTNSGSIDLIYFNTGTDTGYGSVRNIRIRTTHSLPTGGSGIRVNKAEAMKFEDVYLSGFYRNIQLDDCKTWSMFKVFFIGQVDYSLYIANTTSGYYDVGDHSIMDCQFLPNLRDPVGSIYHRNSGGIKVSNTKFNHGGAVPYRADVHYFYDGNQITPDIQFCNCSFENFDVNAIKIQTATAGHTKNVTITGCHFNLGASASKAVTFNKIRYATVMGNVFTGNGSGSTVAIDVTDSEGIKALNEYTGYSAGNTFVLNGSNTDCIDYSNSIIGPSSSTADRPAFFDGVTGKLLKLAPAWVDWSASLGTTGFSSTTTNQGFYIDDGYTIRMFINIVGTSNATTFTITLPVAPSSSYGSAGMFGICFVTNNGTNAIGRFYASGGATTLTIERDALGSAWTNSGAKAARAQFFYMK